MSTLSIVPNIIRKLNPLSLVKRLWKKVRNFPETLKTRLSQITNARNLQRFVPLFLMILFVSLEGLAQTGASGFASATTTIQGYQTQVSNLMKAIGAVIAIVGAFNVYFKMTNGDQDVKKTIMLTIGGCIAFVALGEALPLFFE